MATTGSIPRIAWIATSCVVVSASNAGRSHPGPFVSGNRASVLASARPPVQKETHPIDRQVTMYLKKGVDLRGLRPEIIPALLILGSVTGGDFVVTSGTEDAPGRIPTSLHPKGLAIDVRLPDDQEGYLTMDFKTAVAHAFADTQYDLVWYDTHLHIEFDPK